jgi:uncharacterized protein
VLDQIQDARITIRVNYNNKNFDDIPEMFTLFPHRSRKRISIILRQIFGNCADPASLPEKSKREMAYYQMAFEQGYRLSLAQTLQGPKETYCYADKKGALIIGPQADIFRCGVGTFTSSEKMGDLRYDGTIEWKSEDFMKWDKVDGFQDPDCIKCRYLPLCMGGCRANRVARKAKTGCDQPFELLENMLKISCSRWVAP